MKNGTGGNLKEALSVWDLDFCFVWMGFRFFFMYSWLLIATGWLHTWQSDFLKDPYLSVEMYCSFSFSLAMETEILCKQELIKVNIKLEKVLKAFRWLRKWKDDFSM